MAPSSSVTQLLRRFNPCRVARGSWFLNQSKGKKEKEGRKKAEERVKSEEEIRNKKKETVNKKKETIN